MSRTPEQERLRLEIAAVLEAIADNAGWSDDLWSQFRALMERAEVDGILADAAEELNHYGGVFNSRNLLGIRVKPNEIQVRDYKANFDNLQTLSALARHGKNTKGKIASLKQETCATL
jgi:hypothetical protein